MKALTLKELGLELGDILMCESDNSCMFTYGCEYEVEQAEDGKLGVITDCGFLATTSASLFTNITNTHPDTKPSSGKVDGWPVHNVKRIKLPRVGDAVQCIGYGINVGKSMLRIDPTKALTQTLDMKSTWQMQECTRPH